MDINEVKPYDKNEEKTKQLNRMFDAISTKYDQFNDIMSLGLARHWRKKALRLLRPFNHDNILDIATGTADVAIQSFKYLSPQKVIGIDISEKMMKIGKEKIAKAGLTENIELRIEDVSKLSFENETFEAAITSFGIRNFEKLDESLREINRVLKPNGKFIVLEMSEPQQPLIKFGYKLYTKTFIPFAVKTFSNDPKAYKYLTNSMEAFPQGKDFVSIVEKNQFNCLSYKTFTLGVCSLYFFEKVEKS